MKKPLTATLGITAALLTLGKGPADAVSTILAPVSVSISLGSRNPVVGEPNNLINQTNFGSDMIEGILTALYTSRVTPWSDVDNFQAQSNRTESSDWIGEIELFTEPVLSSRYPTITFDFDAERQIQGFALWNLNSNDGEGLNQFFLTSDNDNDVSNGSNRRLGEIFNATTRREEFVRPQTFSFTPLTTRYVHLNILSNQGHSTDVGIAEVAFQEVPFEF